MIDKIREYMAQCPYLDEFSAINVDYLVDKNNAYSVTEQPSYDPVVEEDITGRKHCVFNYYFDARLIWNSELQNNLENNTLFYNISEWLEENDKNKIYPIVSGVQIDSIKATSNGYLFDTESDEAIYRIVCQINYWK